MLCGEMFNRNATKIRSWFPNIREIDFEKKIFDECISFLESGQMPFYDLKV